MSLTFGSGYEFSSSATNWIQAVRLLDDKFAVLYRPTTDNHPRVKVGTVSGMDISYGSGVKVNNGLGANTDIVALSDDTIIVAYRDQDDTDSGKLRVGSISGTTISFGDEYQHEPSLRSYSNTLCRLTDSKFLICWERFNNGTSTSWGGYARIGTVSGTTVSFGDAVQISIFDLDSLAVETIDEETCVLSHIGNVTKDGECLIISVSGTTISYGSLYGYHDNCKTINSLKDHIQNLQYIGNSGFVVSYVDLDDGHSEAKVGLVSGTVINFGSGYTYASSVGWPVIISHSGIADRIIAIYRDEGNSNYGTVQIGTIDGDQITWSDETIFYNNAVNHLLQPTFLAPNYFVIPFRDDSDSNHGTAIVGNIPVDINDNIDLVISESHRFFATRWVENTWDLRIK